MSASGGSVTTVGGNEIHTFTTVGTSTLVVNQSITAQVLIVAGGGGGGDSGVGRSGGGGGAGGVVYYSSVVIPPGSYTVTVGGGGGGSSSGNGSNGGNSSVSGLSLTTAVGGGGGIASTTASTGGSGGGKWHQSNSGASTGTAGQGNAGGNGLDGGGSGPWAGGGGGGAGAVGGNASSGGAGSGGIGVQYSISGTATYYGGGGGGGVQGNNGNSLTQSSGGSGGGGAGGVIINNTTLQSSPVAGTPGTGGGGGGGCDGFNGTPPVVAGAAGGSGIVIISFTLIVSGLSATIQYAPNISVGTVQLNNVYASTDLVAQGGSLSPVVSIPPGTSAFQGGTSLITTAPTSNTAVYFPGPTGNYLNFGGSSPGNFDTTTSNLFVEAWFYSIGPGGGGDGRIQQMAAVSGPTVTTTEVWGLIYQNSALNLVQFFMYPTSGSATVASLSVTLNYGNWYYLAGTWNYQTKTCYAFSNGVASTGATMAGTPRAYSSTAYSFMIGADFNTGNTANGYIRDLRVTKGGIVPTTSFTPESAPFSVVNPPSYVQQGLNVFTLLNQFNYTTNSSIIQQWLNKTVNTLTYPSFQAQLTPPPIFNNLSAAATSTAVAIYSMALVRLAYTGQVADVRRSTDNAVGNVYADIYGNLTVSGASYASWIGAGTGYIVNWYDQSGAGLTLNQATNANQPTLNTTTTPASITFSAASSTFLVNSSFTFNFGAGSHTISTIISNNTGGCLLYKGASGYPWNLANYKKWWMGNSTNTETSTGNFPTIVVFGGNYAYSGGTIPATGNAAVTFIATSTTNTNIYVNGQQIVTAAPSFSMGTDPANYLYVGIGGSATAYTGNMYQLMVFSSQLGTNDRRIVEGTPNIPINVTQPYWSNVFNSYFSTITVAAPQAYYYGGSVFVPDGRIISLNFVASVPNIGLFNTATNQFTTITANVTGGYQGACLLPDGRVCGVNQTVSAIGIFNPATNAFTTVPTGLSYTTNSYQSCCLMANGNVCFVPRTANSIGIFNPATNSFSTVLNGTANMSGFWGGVTVPDGRVVFCPTDSKTYVGVYNPILNNFTTYPGPSSGVSNQYYGATLMADGRVCFPNQGVANIGIFNPNTNGWSTVPDSTTRSGQQGGCLLPNGLVVMNYTIFNPITNTITAIPNVTNYQNPVLVPDGRVIFPPMGSTTNAYGVLSGGPPAPPELCLHPFFNRM